MFQLFCPALEFQKSIVFSLSFAMSTWHLLQCTSIASTRASGAACCTDNGCSKTEAFSMNSNGSQGSPKTCSVTDDAGTQCGMQPPLIPNALQLFLHVHWYFLSPHLPYPQLEKSGEAYNVAGTDADKAKQVVGLHHEGQEFWFCTRVLWATVCLLQAVFHSLLGLPDWQEQNQLLQNPSNQVWWGMHSQLLCLDPRDNALPVNLRTHVSPPYESCPMVHVCDYQDMWDWWGPPAWNLPPAWPT